MTSGNLFMQRQHVQQTPQNLNRFLPTTGNINKGMDGLTTILGYTQKFLRVVETTTPIIQEYGPMFKNLPAMYRMFKAFKDINGDTETHMENEELSIDLEADKTVEDGFKTPSVRTGISTPKLYI